MSTERERTMTELRAWAAQPPAAVMRPQLVAAAWRAGERNVSALAEAARVSRQTIYADLETHGIDARAERVLGGTVFEKLTELNGYTGDDKADMALMHQRANAAGATSLAADVVRESLILHHSIKWHNNLVDLAPVEIDARAERDRALRAVDLRWEELSSTANFPAAHHSWILAHDKARKAIVSWQAAAQACVDAPGWSDAIEWGLYAQYVPEEKRIPKITGDPSETAATLLAELDAEHARRRELAGQTLAVAGGQQ
ncbi:hypothetical protein [Kitasatospora aburaviensis]|uniref:Uncharacterized protein n=1 Tax=Kitasatospora aburaviensis TaxID=67265 RepID=A0ABW1F2Z0_9ACTN